MCTVTFIPVNKSVLITHSRDEEKLRSRASAPVYEVVNGTKMLFPKDGKAGGSWAGFNEYGHAAVLLNGAFKKHIPTPPYRKSRGLIFLALLASPDLLQGYQSLNLNNIEPFTVILKTGKELFECRWDQQEKHIKKLDEQLPHIWSSSTLYDEQIAEKRMSWFTGWIEEIPTPTLQDVITFHLQGGEGDEQNDIRMQRDNQLSTLSITAMELSVNRGKMKYLDLEDELLSEYNFSFKKAVVESR